VTVLEIRDARASDVPRIATVFRQARGSAMPWLPVLHSSSEDVEFFGRAVEGRTAYVAVLDGLVVGFAVVDEGEHELEHLYLAPEVHRRGIGRRLVDHARASDGGSLRLWCFADNRSGRAFYTACGARELFETDGRGNEERTPDVRLELPGWADGTVGAAGEVGQ
jgi:ribosomal protein S18 acetylase RimI-like enzyme